eukprot:g7903.t1
MQTSRIEPERGEISKHENHERYGGKGGSVLYANLNSKDGYKLSTSFTVLTLINIAFGISWSIWPLDMQNIEEDRREWSSFCVPISDCGKSFGAVLILYAIFQVLAYAAVSLQQNRKQAPNLAVFLLYLSVLSYCIVVILTIIMGIVILHTETGKFCGYESPPFKKEAENFFWATCVALIPLLLILRFQYRAVRSMLQDCKLHHLLSLTESKSKDDDDSTTFDSIENPKPNDS